MDNEEKGQTPGDVVDGKAESEGAGGEMARPEQVAAEKDAEIAAARQGLVEAQARIGQLDEALGKAVASYRALVIESNPALPSELIAGSTIDEVDTSVRNARAIVQRVRQQLEVEASKTQVPAGSPQRSGIDLSGLSAREKIQQAIGGKK